jgi:hypothetical protein
MVGLAELLILLKLSWAPNVELILNRIRINAIGFPLRWTVIILFGVSVLKCCCCLGVEGVLVVKPADVSKLSVCAAADDRGAGPVVAQPTARARKARAPRILSGENKCFMSFFSFYWLVWVV